jgi:hypothetical protein
LQIPVGVNAGFIVHQHFVKTVDIVSPNINLSVVFKGIKVTEFKKMNFNLVFSYDQIVAIVGKQGKAQLVQVKILGAGRLTHWQFGINARKHAVEKMAWFVI